MEEYVGVVAGIGDKENSINLIKPEYDAAVYKWIFGRSRAIVSGLNIEGTTLKRGVCMLCGYMGVLENDIPNIGNRNVYGRFTLNFGDGTDEFAIVTTPEVIPNSNPLSINTAGTYYLYLYADGGVSGLIPQITTPNYPNYAFRSDYAEIVTSSLGEAAVGTTQPVNSDRTNPTRIATCEYVHKQIEEEIDYATYTGNFTSSGGTQLGTYTLKRKSKYVIGTAQFINPSTYLGNLDGNWALFPVGYKPKTAFKFILNPVISNSSQLATFQCDTNGNVTHISPSVSIAGAVTTGIAVTFGYEI